MNDPELLELFDRTARRRPADDQVAHLLDGRVQLERHGEWAGVTWSRLDERSVDEAIAQVAGQLAGLEWEWKLYSYDAPADLGTRLASAGLRPEAQEALAVAPIAELRLGPAAPAELTVECSYERTAVLEMLDVQDVVFNHDHSSMRDELLADVAARPPRATAIVARLEGRAVAAARLAHHPGTQFASFWGTAVVPEYRGRGIFRALIGACAQAGAEHGARYLQADLNNMSEPILARCGFRMLARMTPYTMPASTK